VASGLISATLIALTGYRPSGTILALVLLALFLGLGGFAWSRLGPSRPVAKCVILSLLAHLLLLIYAYSTHVLYGPPGRWTGQTVKVRLRDAADSEEQAPPNASEDATADATDSPQPPVEKVAANDHAASPPQEPAVEPPSPPAEPPPKPIETAIVKEEEPTSPPPLESETMPPEQPKLADAPPAESQPPQPAEPPPASEPPEASNLAIESAPPPVSPVEPPPQFVTATRPAVPVRPGDGQEVPQPLRGRIVADRLKAAQPFGATPRSEAAVAAALDWLASAQSEDGRWDADAFGAGRETRTLGQDRHGAGARADTGITGLALLALLGCGETHLAGAHRVTVQHGLEFLLASQARDGSLAGQAELYAAMYCHGMATLALSEAYALSGDDRLLRGLRAALEYSIAAQSSAGGWRYRPSEPTDPGDMSQFGWQLMSLKSAEMGGIPLPAATRVRMVRFLQSCSTGKNRGMAGYQPGHRASRTMTAESLVCRHFLAVENSPAALDEGAAFVMQELPSRQTPNFYYWYYGTLAMFQRQGADWRRWNEALQQELLARQRWDGSLAGSYDPDDQWGGYGGRVYSTALATLSLEVYYRYLPVHGANDEDARLTDRPWQPALPR
jgi:outer membrane biosynthesis protein TonB